MRSRLLALAPLALFSCSRPDAAPRAPEVRAESAPHAPQTQRLVLPAAAVPALRDYVHAPNQGPPEDQHGTVNAAGPGAAVQGARVFGQPLTSNLPVAHLNDIVHAPTQFSGHPIRVEGTVAAVCQEMGCWMEIRDDATQAHIRMHGHSFFVPRDINGKRAAVQATLVAAHNPTECDREAHAQTGRVAQVELDATGVQVFN